MKYYLLFIFFILLTYSSVGQENTITDSLQLEAVTVNGFSSGEIISKQEAAISYIDSKVLNDFSPNNPVMAWNTMPGVTLEQRAVGSYRVNIRGSSLRSPFGVRDVKFYWNGLPFTESNGTTALNLLSMSQMQEIEVIRGPSGSLYGAGLGGVVQLTNFPSIDSPLKLSISGGSFNQLGLGVSGSIEKGKLSTYYDVDYLQNEGYRDQNGLNRKNYQISSRYQLNDQNQIDFHLLYNDLYYEIPGGLTAEQFQNDPTQARAGSESQNSSIDQKTLFYGLNYTSVLSKNLSQTTALSITNTWFDHPFIFDYKIDRNNEVALRNQWTYEKDFETTELRMDAGFEFQYGNNLAKNYGNEDGERDTINFSDRLRINRGLLFAQAEFGFGDWSIIGGFSTNLLQYSVNRSINKYGEAFVFTRRFNNQIIPRASLSYSWDTRNMTYASISEGFSSPTLDEIRTNEGSVNRSLEAEKGLTYELGHKFYTSRFHLTVTAFRSALSQTITSYTDENGTSLFRNAGSTDQMGLEIGAYAILYRSKNSFLNRIDTRLAYNYYNFKFSNYSNQQVNYSGNKLTGVPQHNLNYMLGIGLGRTLEINMHNRYVSEIPLNDANTVFSEPYLLTNINMTYTLNAQRTLKFTAGIENLFDEQYSLGFDLNPFGERYYQPAPDRNYYISMEFIL